MIPNKEYIQPQWILDCINSARLLPIAEYEPGKKLPPHVSPFYEFSEDGHLKVNKRIHEEEEIKDLPPVNPVAANAANKANEAEEDEKLREMLISKNKKRLLTKLREEQSKKKKVRKTKK